MNSLSLCDVTINLVKGGGVLREVGENIVSEHEFKRKNTFYLRTKIQVGLNISKK